MSGKRPLLTCLAIAGGTLLVALGLLVALVVSLALAPRQRYEDDDASAVLDAGTDLMQRWLAEHEPDATLTESENVLFSYPSGPTHLTDYVRGTFERDGVERSFVINSVSGEVYLEDASGALDAALPAYVTELLGLPQDTGFVTARGSLLVPFQVEGSSHAGPTDTLDLGAMLPAGVTDVESWLRLPSGRGTVSIDIYAHPSDDYDLSELTFERLNRIREHERLAFSPLYLATGSEELDALYDHYYYEHYAQARMEPFLLWYRDAYREEELDRTGTPAEVGSAQVDPARDLAIVATGQGWGLNVRRGTPDFPYFLYVPSDSELLGHTYRWAQADV